MNWITVDCTRPDSNQIEEMKMVQSKIELRQTREYRVVRLTEASMSRQIRNPSPTLQFDFLFFTSLLARSTEHVERSLDSPQVESNGFRSRGRSDDMGQSKEFEAGLG
jgi:hypothetical protein